MPSDQDWMRHALALAKKAESAGEVPVGAVVVDADGSLLAEAWNLSIAEHDPAGHAEIRALRAAGQKVGNYRLTGATLYVTLEPCPMCAGALVHARVGRLVFGAPDPRTGAAGTVFQLADNPALNHQIAISSGILEAECADQLREFFKKKRARAKALKQERQRLAQSEEAPESKKP